jgi:hypothetical protein
MEKMDFYAGETEENVLEPVLEEGDKMNKLNVK